MERDAKGGAFLEKVDEGVVALFKGFAEYVLEIADRLVIMKGQQEIGWWQFSFSFLRRPAYLLAPVLSGTPSLPYPV